MHTFKHCSDVWQVLRTYCTAMLVEVNRLPAGPFMDGKKGNCAKPVVLVPDGRECRKRRIVVGNRFPLGYTTQGTRVAGVFHENCLNCGTSYYPSHAHYSGQEVETFFDLKRLKYLLVTLSTVFEIEYLEQVIHTLSICNATFESVATLYNVNNSIADGY